MSGQFGLQLPRDEVTARRFQYVCPDDMVRAWTEGPSQRRECIRRLTAQRGDVDEDSGP